MLYHCWLTISINYTDEHKNIKCKYKKKNQTAKNTTDSLMFIDITSVDR